jgi:N6-L-threonylcarbamoyladenine synthase
MAGGVAANSHLRKRLNKLAEEKGVKLFIPSLDLCGDNGAMIAAAAYYEYKMGNLADSSLNASALDKIEFEKGRTT